MQNPFEEAMNRKFKIYHGGWVGSLLPSPEGSMHSKYSKEVNSSNYTGIADDRIDDLIENYNSNWEIKEERLLLGRSIWKRQNGYKLKSIETELLTNLVGNLQQQPELPSTIQIENNK